MEGEERRWEKSGRRRGKKHAGKHGRRGSRRMDGFDGDAGVVRDYQNHEAFGGHRRDGASYRGNRRSETSEGLDRRRTILGEVSGRY